MLYESSARAEEELMLDVPDLDTSNRCAVLTRKGVPRDLIAWQTATVRLLPRVLSGGTSGPLFLTDRKARPSVVTHDVDSSTGRVRLSYLDVCELVPGPYRIPENPALRSAEARRRVSW